MVYITHVRLSAGGTTLKHITDVRWFNPSTQETNSCSRAAMVDFIDNKKGEARVRDRQGEVQVLVVHDHPPYLRTAPDNRGTDNLLSLPRF